MPQSPSFSISGGPFFGDTSTSFLLVFENPSDQRNVQSYQWYLDKLLVVSEEGAQFTSQVSCGEHTIGVRVLSTNKWTGLVEMDFQTCKTLLTATLSGPNSVNAGGSAAYNVTWTFTDGTTADMTTGYSFSSTTGGSFSANILNVAPSTGDDNGPFELTVTAAKESSSLSKQITLVIPDVNAAGILVVDLFDNTSLNVIGLISNSEVINNHLPAYTGVNIIPARNPPADALILASDFIDQPVLNWRFLFNLGVLKAIYPDSEDFICDILGRAATAATVNGAYNLKNEATSMVLNGAAGAYLPTTIGGSQLGESLNFNTQVPGGANGNYDQAGLTLIIRLNFNVATNSITYLTNI